jgi:Xaa-Pro aminopeptidase
VPSHWKTREWISGFNGSAGTAVVTRGRAALWTDSRYFLAAEEQLQETPFALMRERIPGTPSVAEWLSEEIGTGGRVGVDGWVFSIAEEHALREELAFHGLDLVLAEDPAETLWEGRPAIPQAPVCLHPIAYAGKSAAEKIKDLRERLQARHVEATLVCKLDEVAWLANIRGTDVHCCPLVVAYMWITQERAVLYVDDAKLDDTIRKALLEQGIECRPYGCLVQDLPECGVQSVLLDVNSTNSRLGELLPEACKIVSGGSLIAPEKAVKNETEINGFRNAMYRDGIAMVKFLHWLLPAVKAGGQTELSVSRKLEEFRAMQPLYKGLSFDTIAGYAAHGAIVHYEADEKSDCELLPKGLLLLDSGAQYQDGTTDITRTIALGTLTEQERIDYTLVLRGHIRLAMVRFPAGSSGTQLDVCARYAMWQQGVNYLHGTGHGVGSFLNVHEGPHQIRMNNMPAPLLPGVTVTNEPGLYKAGRFGIRIENTMLVIPSLSTEFGEYCEMEPLTLCPISKEPIVPELLGEEATAYLNSYHKQVYDTLAPYLQGEELQYLKEACAALEAV